MFPLLLFLLAPPQCSPLAPFFLQILFFCLLPFRKMQVSKRQQQNMVNQDTKNTRQMWDWTRKLNRKKILLSTLNRGKKSETSLLPLFAVALVLQGAGAAPCRPCTCRFNLRESLWSLLSWFIGACSPCVLQFLWLLKSTSFLLWGSWSYKGGTRWRLSI